VTIARALKNRRTAVYPVSISGEAV
jgi:hypothetical protein